MHDNNLTIEQVYEGLSMASSMAMDGRSAYRDEIDSAGAACTDILDRFEMLGAQTVKDIMRMLERLEEVV